MCEGDMHYWNIGPKMIKEEEDLKGVEDVIKKHYKFIKSIHIYLASKSSYPGISSYEYSSFCNSSKIKDSKLKQDSIDRAMIAT